MRVQPLTGRREAGSRKHFRSTTSHTCYAFRTTPFACGSCGLLANYSQAWLVGWGQSRMKWTQQDHNHAEWGHCSCIYIHNHFNICISASFLYPGRKGSICSVSLQISRSILYFISIFILLISNLNTLLPHMSLSLCFLQVQLQHIQQSSMQSATILLISLTGSLIGITDINMKFIEKMRNGYAKYFKRIKALEIKQF